MTETTDALSDGLSVEITGAMARVTLDLPKALNALTARMRARLGEGLSRFSRDPQVYCAVIRSTHPNVFSAGSDVREVIESDRIGRERARRLFRDEYALNWQCECFSKPTISLIDGMVMGGGVGISLYGTHRVAGEGYRFAMPEAKIGLFPDVGTCHAFARMPDGIGMYLGLTGNAIGRADAYRLGLATHVIPAHRFAGIEAELADVQPVDTVLDARHEEPGAGELERHRETIARAFTAPSVLEIVARLEDTSGADADWARQTAAEVRRRSPMSLAITFRHIREAIARDLRETLHVDYRLACRSLDGHDFHEGVRALISEKDNAPSWWPERIEDVTAAAVEAQFDPMGAGELVLPTRQEMQAARV